MQAAECEGRQAYGWCATRDTSLFAQFINVIYNSTIWGQIWKINTAFDHRLLNFSAVRSHKYLGGDGQEKGRTHARCGYFMPPMCDENHIDCVWFIACIFIAYFASSLNARRLPQQWRSFSSFIYRHSKLTENLWPSICKNLFMPITLCNINMFI